MVVEGGEQHTHLGQVSNQVAILINYLPSQIILSALGSMMMIELGIAIAKLQLVLFSSLSPLEVFFL